MLNFISVGQHIGSYLRIFLFLVLFFGMVERVHASHVLTITVESVPGLVTGDFVRVHWTARASDGGRSSVLIQETRVVVEAVVDSNRLKISLPCISGQELYRVNLAQSVGTLSVELVRKGGVDPKRSGQLLELLPGGPSNSAWCNVRSG
ncbi:MAG: hypothetical protein J0M12_11185 [Deltaproteobacteria bacterium]|nr:hypothetical protein [Deltaproteobacteria bacterium]